MANVNSKFFDGIKISKNKSLQKGKIIGGKIVRCSSSQSAQGEGYGRAIL